MASTQMVRSPRWFALLLVASQAGCGLLVEPLVRGNHRKTTTSPQLVAREPATFYQAPPMVGAMVSCVDGEKAFYRNERQAVVERGFGMTRNEAKGIMVLDVLGLAVAGGGSAAIAANDGSPWFFVTAIPFLAGAIVDGYRIARPARQRLVVARETLPPTHALDFTPLRQAPTCAPIIAVSLGTVNVNSNGGAELSSDAQPVFWQSPQMQLAPEVVAYWATNTEASLWAQTDVGFLPIKADRCATLAAYGRAPLSEKARSDADQNKNVQAPPDVYGCTRPKGN